MSALPRLLTLVLAAWACRPAAAEPALAGAGTRLDGGRTCCTFLSFTAGGKQLVAVQGDHTARLWDIATRKLIRSIPFGQGLQVWAVTPDGSTLVGVDDRLVMHRWTLAGDRTGTTVELKEAQQLNVGLRPQEAHLLPDGTLALLAWPVVPDSRLNRHCVSFWEPTTGKLVRWSGDPGVDFRADFARLSPDGRFTAAMEAIFETRTGARRALPASPFGLGGMPRFSPDGRLLAITARDTRIWEVATARVVADLPIGSTEVVVFSPDGRRLACEVDGRVVIWDVGQRKAIADWGVKSEPGAMAFSPDGRTLATGHADGAILLWPVPAPLPAGRWSEADARETWELLGNDSSANGYTLIWHLAEHPVEAVRFLSKKVALNPAADMGELNRLVAALDSPRFAERETASKRLRELGRAAEGPLRRELRRELSLEQVARIESLLAALEPIARPRGDDLRAVRAVAVLEHVGTEEARRILVEWAERAASPNVADEAGRSLARLKARK